MQVTEWTLWIVLIVFQEDTGVTVAEGVLGMWKTTTVMDHVKKDFMDDTVRKVSLCSNLSRIFRS